MINILRKIFYKKSQWTIGFYIIKKNELLNLDINKKPISLIKYHDISDFNASFVADPFLIKHSNKIYCFFEILKTKEHKGVIGVAESTDGINFKYKKVVLEENFHLSYPNVFRINNEYYMVPESGANNDVRLYKAKNFPYEWEFQKTLLFGNNFTDATFLYQNNIWYMFVSNNLHNELNIYYSENFDGKYLPHPLNPIYKDNKKYSRPAGNFINLNSNIYRLAQDCSTRYGKQVYLMKIEEITTTSYKETMLKTLIQPAKKQKWNARKMHHFNYIEISNDQYLVVTDGEGYE